MTTLLNLAALAPSPGEVRFMLGGHTLQSWFSTTGTTTLAVAWLVAVVWLLVMGPVLIFRHRQEAAIFGALVLGALALRLAIPWGPLDFAEASRCTPAWDVRIDPYENFVTMPILFAFQRLVGASSLLLVRYGGPVFGALCVGFIYLLGRNAGVSRTSAVIGAAVLLVFPAHVRYSASGVLTVPGMTIWIGLFALALATSIKAVWKIPMLVACVVLGVFARPEYRILAFALIPLTFTAGWRWRDRIAVAILAFIGLLPYASRLGMGADHAKMDPMWGTFVKWLFLDPRMNPIWFIAAGLVGLFAGKFDRRVQVSFVVATGLLAVSYWILGIEYNPVWGQWRYAVATIPIIALGVGACADRYVQGPKRELRLRLIAAATVATGLLHYGAYTRPIDIQLEFAYVRETAPRILAGKKNLVLIMNDAQKAAASVPTETTTSLAIVTSIAPPVNIPYGCDIKPMGDLTVRLWSPTALLKDCIKDFTPENTVMYVGLYQPPLIMGEIKKRFDLAPIDERTVDGAPAAQHMDTQCIIQDGTLGGSSIDDCHLQLGWYTITPRVAAAQN